MEFITVTSTNQDPGDFASNFTNAIQLSENYEVALLKIAHPPVQNINSQNNKLYVKNKTSNAFMRVTIPPGFYKTSHDILIELHQQLMKTSKEMVSENVNTLVTLKYNRAGDNSEMTLKFVADEVCFAIDSYTNNNILHFLNFKLDFFSSRTLSILNYDLRTEDKIGLIYSSIVSNSLIDSNQSRLLDIVPLKSDDEHTFYEGVTPVFHKMSAASFIDITFEIREISGEFVKFSKDYPTILTLAIRKKAE